MSGTNSGTPVKHRVSAALIDMLADMRGVNKDTSTEPKRRRRKKINVAPGKSIGLEDLLVNEPSASSVTGTAGTSASTVVNSADGGVSRGVNDDSSESDVEKSDTSSDADTGTDSDSNEDMDTNGSQVDSDDAPLSSMIQDKIKPKVGNFYVIQFDTGKQGKVYKHYVGKVLNVDSKRRECEIAFARRTQRTSLLFYWPTVVDQSYVGTEQLKRELTVQKVDRRGRIAICSHELEPYSNSLQ